MPRTMYEEVARLVTEDPSLYSSVADFAQAALREEIRKARRKRLTENAEERIGHWLSGQDRE